MGTLRATIFGGIKALYKGTNDLGTPQQDVALSDLDEITSGTGSFQSDLLFSDTRTLAASATEDLDLAGVLEDAFGNLLTFVEITAVYIKAHSSNTNNVVVGGATAELPLGFSTAGTFSIPPSGKFLVTAPVGGWAVGAGATDDLKIANSGGSTGVTYDIIIMGRSA